MKKITIIITALAMITITACGGSKTDDKTFDDLESKIKVFCAFESLSTVANPETQEELETNSKEAIAQLDEDLDAVKAVKVGGDIEKQKADFEDQGDELVKLLDNFYSDLAGAFDDQAAATELANALQEDAQAIDDEYSKKKYTDDEPNNKLADIIENSCNS